MSSLGENKKDSDGDADLNNRKQPHSCSTYTATLPLDKALGTGAIFKGSGVTRTLANFREYKMKHYL